MGSSLGQPSQKLKFLLQISPQEQLKLLCEEESQETKMRQKTFMRPTRRTLLPPLTPSCGSWSEVISAELQRAQRAAETLAGHDRAHPRPSLWRGPPGCLGLLSCPRSAVGNTDSCRHTSVPGAARGVRSRPGSLSSAKRSQIPALRSSSSKVCPTKPAKPGRNVTCRVRGHKDGLEERRCWGPGRTGWQGSRTRSRGARSTSPCRAALCPAPSTAHSPPLRQAESQIPWERFRPPHNPSHQGWNAAPRGSALLKMGPVNSRDGE